MLELVGLLAAFIVIFALRFKGFDFALTIFIASGIVGLTAEKPYTIFIDVTLETIRDMRTWELCAAVAFITILGFVLKDTGLMVELIEKLRGFLPSRFLLALIPALFGILSMPGGALMSAPFNDPEADRLNLKSEQKTFINIWFRHVWYWASPISPTTILAVSLTGIALRDFIVINFPLFLATWVIGFVVSWRWISRDEREASMVKDYKGTMMGLSPIVIIVALTLLEVPVWLAVMVGVFIVIILKRVSVRRSLTFLSKGIKWDIVAAVFATLFFRYMLVASGSVTSLLRSILATGVPLMLLLLVIPILVGTISANPTMGIGIVFPLLIPLIAKMNVNILTIIYAGLVAGYNGSPMHLCLILTNQYYRSDMSKVYRYLLPSIVLLFVVMVIYHVILGGLLTTDLTSLV